MNNRRLIALLAAGALLLTGCSIPGGDTAESAESVVVGIPNDVTGREADPHLTGGGTAIPFLLSVWETLYAFDEEGEPQPNVVESDEVSDDKLTWTLNIRPGQTFHNGEVLDAEDVAYSIDRARGADEELDGPTWTSGLTKIETVEAVDETTVVLTLKEADPILRYTLAFLGGTVVPKDYIEEVGNDGFLAKPVGSGPYRFVEASVGQKIELEAFDDYVFEPRPEYQDVTLKVLAEPASRVAQLRSGDIDLAVDVDVSQIETLENEGFTIGSNPSGIMLSITLNHESEAIADPRIRQAMNLAIDRDAIVEHIYQGHAEPSASPDPVVSADALDKPEYDPDRAKELLKEAGYGGETIVLDFPSGRYPQGDQVMQTVQGNLADVGMKVELKPMESNQWLEGLVDRTLDDGSLNITANQFYDSYQPLWAAVACDGPWSQWCSERVDEQLDRANALEGDERAQAFVELSEYFREDPPVVTLVHYNMIYAMDESVEWTPTPGIRNYSFVDVRPAA